MRYNIYIFCLCLACLVLIANRCFSSSFCVSTSAQIQAALNIASSNGEHDQIHIVQGTYVGNFVYASTEQYGVTVEGGYTVGCISSMVDASNTVLDGNKGGIVLILSSDQAVDFLVDGLTIQNGSTTSDGGGICILSLNGNIILSNNIIINNAADNGGGVFVPSEGRPDTIILTNNVISNNTAKNNGGGVYIEHTNTATLTNNIISNNTARDYGGLCLSASGGTATLTNNSISNNTADTVGGSYLYTRGGTLTLTNNTINNNIAEIIGGLFLRPGICNLTNNIIANNTASYNHTGGVYLDHPDSATLTNNTIVNNITAESGGGIKLLLVDNDDSADIYNNILWNNNAGEEGNDLYIDNDSNNDYIPSVVNIFNNDFDQSASGTYLEISFSIHSSNLDNQNPRFVDDANGDYHLQASSPCIDKGTDLGAPSTDIEGTPRPKGLGYDIGAYEAYLLVALIPYAPDPTNDTTPTLEWNNVTGASTYTLQYSEQSDFSTYTELGSLVGDACTISEELSDGTWYWRIRAFDGNGVAGWWTSADSFAVDTVSPNVSSTVPANSATEIATNTTVTATFLEEMDSFTITTDTFFLSGSGNIAGTVTYSGTTAIFTPTSSLNYNKIYTATITTGAKDLAGNALEADYTWSFTTGSEPDTTAPTVSSTAPANNATDVAVDTTITATFSEEMDSSTITTDTFFLSGSGNIAGTVTYSGTTAIFTPTSSLNYNKTYTATITTGAKDLASNVLERDHTWVFTTESETDDGDGDEEDGDGDEEDGDGDEGKCFIATATYGSPMEPHVKILREFRDHFLLTNSLGKVLVEGLYYNYSPFLADFIEDHHTLRAVVRWCLLPIVGISWISLNLGPIPTLALILLFSTGLIGLVGFSRRLKRR